MKKENTLTSGGILRGLLSFAIPVMLSSILQVVYSATDLLIVGNFAETSEVSGVTTASMVMMLVTLGISGLGTGVTVLMGQFTGGKNESGVKKTVGAAVFLFAGIAAALVILLLALNGPVVSALSAPTEAVKATRSYLYVCTLGIFSIFGYNLTSCIFRGVGDSKTPLIVVAISCCINIALDLWFVKSLQLGAFGAALATVIAQTVSFVVSLLFILKRGIGVPITKQDIRPSGEYSKKIVKIGLPLSLQEMLITFSFLIITTIVNKMGVTESASVGIVEKLMGFLMMPTMAMATAVATMSSHNFGAGQSDRARKTLWIGVLISLVPAVVINAFVWLSPMTLPTIFTKDADVIYNASLYLRTYTLDCLFVCIVFNFNSFFASCNRSLFSMAHSLLTTFLIRVPVTIFFSRLADTTLFEIGFAAPLSSIGSAIMCLCYFRYLRSRDTMQKTAESAQV